MSDLKRVIKLCNKFGVEEEKSYENLDIGFEYDLRDPITIVREDTEEVAMTVTKATIKKKPTRGWRKKTEKLGEQETLDKMFHDFLDIPVVAIDELTDVDVSNLSKILSVFLPEEDLKALMNQGQNTTGN